MNKLLAVPLKMWLGMIMVLFVGGCTVKAVGDPNRPITIQAHITVDIKGLEKTATGIEDYVSGGAPADSQQNQGETK